MHAEPKRLVRLARRRPARWSAAANAAVFVAASGLAIGPDTWLEWLSWGWTAGFAVAVRMTLLAAAAIAMAGLLWTIFHERSSR